MKKGYKYIRKMSFVVMALMLLLSGCSTSRMPQSSGYYYYDKDQLDQDTSEKSTEDSQESSDADAEYLLLLSIDTVAESLVVHNYGNDRNYEYHIGLGTRFLDKYGNTTPVNKFTPGVAVELGSLNTDGALTEVRLSDKVWTYDDVVKFSYDTSHNMIKIAGNKYSYDLSLFVFSNGEQTSLGAISSDDTLRIVGDDKKILSIDITTGHGSLSLVNTDLFDGSYMQIGEKIFVKVTPGLVMDLPEGSYTLAVANDGWGSTTEITIERGQNLEVDLDAIKGDGPKYGQILFVTDNVDTQISVDGEALTDYTEPVELRYGYHKISMYLDNDNNWTKILYVNSPTATIEITTGVTSASNSSDSQSASESNNASESQSSSGTNNTSETNTTGSSTTGSDNSDSTTNSSTDSHSPENHGPSSQNAQNTGNSDNNTSSDTTSTTSDDYLKDYLTTLSEMLQKLN